MDNYRIIIRYNLQFFAEGEGGEKTEEATSKKLEKAREEGQVAKSADLVSGASLLVLFLAIKLFLGFSGNKFIEVFTEVYSYISTYGNDSFDGNVALAIIRRSFVMIMLISAPFILGAILCAIVVNALQIKWKVTTKTLKPKFDKIDPIKGMKKLFSKDKIFELIKSLAKCFIIAYVVYSAIVDNTSLLLALYDYTLLEGLAIIEDIIVGLGIKISTIFLIIGFADLIYQKLKFKKDMRMTKQEIKEEYKQSEGDPQIKGKIKRKMQEISMKRMMQDLESADVVITNPTHFAVGVKYDKESSAAPIVVAKGEDYLAQRIKDVAKEHDIEIYEDKPLARMLYFNVDIGKEIPPELYQTVAEVLAYVYKLKNKI